MYGTSGGALTGALLFLDIDLDALAEYIYICAAKARGSWRGAFLLRDYCRGAITQFCTKDAHKILAGRLEISITRIFPWYKNIRVNEFPTTYLYLRCATYCAAQSRALVSRDGTIGSSSSLSSFSVRAPSSFPPAFAAAASSSSGKSQRVAPVKLFT